MSAFVRRFSFKPADGSEVLLGITVLELCRCVVEPRGMTALEVERVLWLEPAGRTVRIKGIGEFKRTR